MDYRTLTDTQLITLCLNRPSDRRCVQEFVRRNSSVVYQTIRWTFLRCGRFSRPDVEDTFQEVFASLFRNDCRTLRGYDPSRAHFGTLLTHIARNAALNSLKRNRARTEELDEDIEGDTPQPDDLLQSAEERAALGRALEGLTDKEKVFFRLYFEEGMPPEEIASVLGIGTDTVYSKKAKVQQKLRELVQARQGRFDEFACI